MYSAMLVGGQVRAGLISMIFDKSLKISGRAKAGGNAAAAMTMNQHVSTKEAKEVDKMEVTGGWSNGRVVNLMGTDTYRVDQAASWCHLCWTSGFQIIVTLTLLLINLSYSALAGFALLVVSCSKPTSDRFASSRFVSQGHHPTAFMDNQSPRKTPH